MKDTFHRTLSPAEVQEKRIMITRDALRFFPKPFRKFSLGVGEKTYELAVEAVECQCMGPAKPHEHYWLPVKECLEGVRWERGGRVVLTKTKDLVYTMSVE